MKRIYIDVETTGVEYPACGVIQIAGLVEINGVEMEAFNYTCQPFPTDRIEDEALSVNSRSRGELAGFNDPGDVHTQFTTLLSRYVNRFDRHDKLFFLAYNAEFDVQHLRAWFTKCGDSYFGSYFWHPPLCIMQLAAWNLVGERHVMPNFKLGTVANHLKVAGETPVEQQQLHDALVDVRLAREVYMALVERKGA